MDTVYIGPLDFTSETHRPVQAELRLEDSHGQPGVLSIGTYDYDETGEDLGTVTLLRGQVIELHDALTRWLGLDERAADPQGVL